jgi:flagellar basal body-associated protein FliL
MGDGGWSYDSWNEHQKVMHWALGNDVNSALTLRLPGVLTYTRDVVLGLFQEYTDESISMEDMKASVVRGWNDATTTKGKLSQVQIYRASLGLDPLSDFDLCRLHRVEMDAQDNTICVKYDPKDDDSTNVILIAVLVPFLAIVFAGVILFMYFERKRRQSDAIWKIDKDDLKFSDPPEIAGRGTFGLVVKAEYVSINLVY